MSTAPHYLYRCYDSDDLLLYIGCTSNVRRRLAAHLRGQGATSRWISVCMDRYEVDDRAYLGLAAGREAEALAIHLERPLFNYQGRTDVEFSASMARLSVAPYLISRGHVDLALETLCACWRETREAGGFDEWCAPHASLSRQAVA